jgi:PAS domain S-box-containing protein
MAQDSHPPASWDNLFSDSDSAFYMRLQTYLAAARRIATAPEESLSVSHTDVILILEAAPQILIGLETATELYRQHMVDHIDGLVNTNGIRVASVALILIAQTLIVFRPVMKRLRHKTAQLSDEVEQREGMRRALEESQHFVTQVTSGVPDLIIVFDIIENKRVYWNRDAMEGFEAIAMSAWGKTLEEMEALIHPDDRRIYHESVIRGFSLADGEIHKAEYRLLIPDAEPRWVNVRTAVFNRQPDGNPRQILTLIQDVTDRRESEQRALAFEVQRKYNTLLTDFVRATSHEVRTPLAIIGASAGMMARMDERDKRNVKLEQIEDQIEHMSRMIAELHEVARLDMMDTTRQVRIPAESLLQPIVRELHKRIEARELDVHVDFAEGPNEIMGDPAMLRGALERVLDNAIRHAPSGGHIEVHTASVSDGIMIEVYDDGLGIDENNLPHLFEPFYKADPARGRDGSGAGVGLTIVRKIMDIHGGQVEIDSVPGKGTTCRLIVPAAPPDEIEVCVTGEV